MLALEKVKLFVTTTKISTKESSSSWFEIYWGKQDFEAQKKCSFEISIWVKKGKFNFLQKMGVWAEEGAHFSNWIQNICKKEFFKSIRLKIKKNSRNYKKNWKTNVKSLDLGNFFSKKICSRHRKYIFLLLPKDTQRKVF